MVDKIKCIQCALTFFSGSSCLHKSSEKFRLLLEFYLLTPLRDPYMLILGMEYLQKAAFKPETPKAAKDMYILLYFP